MLRTIKIPVVLSRKEITENVLKDTDSDKESKTTAISSGRGDAIIKPAITARIYFLKKLGVFLIK